MHKQLFFIFGLALFAQLLGVTQVNAAAFSSLSSLSVASTAEDVVVDNNIAYIADGDSGLQIYNVSDAGAPVYIGQYDLDAAFTIAKYNNYVYVGTNTSIYALDVSIPAEPTLVDSIGAGYVRDLTVSGSTLYAATGTLLFFFNLTDPTDLLNFSQFNLGTQVSSSGTALGLDVVGNFTYVAYGSVGLVVLETAAGVTTLEGQLNTTGQATGVDVVGTTAYVADGANGLVSLNIVDLNSIALLDTLDTPVSASRVIVTNNVAHVADGTSFRLISVTDPADLTALASSPFDAVGLDLVGTTAYGASYEDGLSIFNVTDPAEPELLKSLQTAGSPFNITQSGNIALVAGGTYFTLVNISDPRAPSVLDKVNAISYVRQVVKSGNYLLAADGGSGITVFDASNTASVTNTGTSYNTFGQAMAIDLVSSNLFVADYNGGLVILNATDPTNLALSGSTATTTNATDVVVNGNYAYVAVGSSGVDIVDISLVGSPTVIRTVNTPGTATRLTISGSYLYVADDTSGMQIINIADPTTASIVGAYNTPESAQEIAILNSIAFITDNKGGVVAVNINTPTNPTVTATYTTLSSSVGIILANNTLFVGDTRLHAITFDGDGDGVTTFQNDCNDNDSTVSTNQTYYQDADSDGLGNSTVTTSVCSATAPAGYVSNSSDTNDDDQDNDGVITSVDCDDADATIFTVYYQDADGDGLGDATILVCSGGTAPSGYIGNNSDDNDTPSESPDSVEDDDSSGELIIDNYPTANWLQVNHPTNSNIVLFVRRNGKQLHVVNTNTNTLAKQFMLNKKVQNKVVVKRTKLRGKNLLVIASKSGVRLRTQLWKFTNNSVKLRDSQREKFEGKAIRININKTRSRIILYNSNNNLQYRVSKRLTLKPN